MTDQPTEPPHAGNLADWMRWAETKIALSLAVSLYFNPPPSSFAEGLLGCYRDYLDLCEPHLRWYASDPGGKYRRADPKALRVPFRRLPEAVAQGKGLAWVASSAEHYLHAAPFQFKALVLPGRDGSLSYIRAAFPVEMFSDNFSGFANFVRSFAGHAPFYFGYGGLSFSESTEIATRQVNEIYLVPVAMRFSGVEVEGHISTPLCCKEAIKGVNWLTLLSPHFVEKLGGKEALRGTLSGAIDLYDLPTGIMVQAGPTPGLGDVNAEERLPPYREVHRAVARVRVAEHWGLGDNVFTGDATRRWMSRFDD